MKQKAVPKELKSLNQTELTILDNSKNRSILKFLFKTIIVFIFLFAFVGFTFYTSARFIDLQIPKINALGNSIIKDSYSCTIDTKSIHYQGVCSDSILEKMREVVEGEFIIQALEQCSNTYAMRTNFCKELSTKVRI